MVSLNFNFHRYTIRRHWNYIQLWGQRRAFACLSATAMWVAIDQPTGWSSNCSTLRPSYLFITNATCSVSCWLINRQAPHYHETLETLEKHKKMFRKHPKIIYRTPKFVPNLDRPSFHCQEGILTHHTGMMPWRSHGSLKVHSSWPMKHCACHLHTQKADTRRGICPER